MTLWQSFIDSISPNWKTVETGTYEMQMLLRETYRGIKMREPRDVTTVIVIQKSRGGAERAWFECIGHREDCSPEYARMLIARSHAQNSQK